MKFKSIISFICMTLGLNINCTQQLKKRHWAKKEVEQGKITQFNAPETWGTFNKRGALSLLSEYNNKIKLSLNKNIRPNVKDELQDIEDYIYRTRTFGNKKKSRAMIEELNNIAKKWLTDDELKNIRATAKKRSADKENISPNINKSSFSTTNSSPIS